MKIKLRECSICGDTFEGFGNNAEPVSKGRCCDRCNTYKIIPARLGEVINNKHRRLKE